MNTTERWLLVPLALAIAATAIGLLIYARVSPAPTYPTELQLGYSSAVDDFDLTAPPPGYEPDISQFQAEQIALESSPDAAVRESALVRATVQSTSRITWIVSMEPAESDVVQPTFPCSFPNGNPYHPDARDSFKFTFIDPETGDMLAGYNVLDPPDGVECEGPHFGGGRGA